MLGKLIERENVYNRQRKTRRLAIARFSQKMSVNIMSIAACAPRIAA